jgi:hypothetical protein
MFLYKDVLYQHKKFHFANFNINRSFIVYMNYIIYIYCNKMPHHNYQMDNFQKNG